MGRPGRWSRTGPGPTPTMNGPMTEDTQGRSTPEVAHALTDARPAQLDAELLTLAVEMLKLATALRQAEVTLGEVVPVANDNASEVRAAHARIAGLIAHTAAKTGRLCASLATGDGCTIAIAEAELAESCRTDQALAHHSPQRWR
jgi:hypothetical protein